jgi:parallel beta-helix repeat protein
MKKLSTLFVAFALSAAACAQPASTPDDAEPMGPDGAEMEARDGGGADGGPTPVPADGASPTDSSSPGDGGIGTTDSGVSPPSCPTGDAPVCEATAGRCFYFDASAGSGSGTHDDPFGMNDLPDPSSSYCNLTGALTDLSPGDVVYFRGGTYDLHTCPTGAYAYGYIRAGRSGEPGRPITFKAYPGEMVTLRVVSGSQPAFGSASNTGATSHVRFEGFRVGPQANAAARISGDGVEVAFCEIIGTTVSTTSNHDGLRLEDSTAAWIHHNRIHGVRGDSTNSAGIKLYTSTDAIIEDNYFYDNSAGVFDKDSGIRNTYRRNYFTGNGVPWYGNNQGSPSTVYIYDNVFDGLVELHSRMRNSEIHDNLVRSDTLADAWGGDVWGTRMWNNVVLATGSSIVAYREPQSPFSMGGSNPHFSSVDYNVYSAAPRYEFGEYSSSSSVFDLSAMRSRGFETNSQVVSSATDVYTDTTTWTISSGFTTAGRDGDPVGPDDVAAILDETRYGPRACP